jgi:pimeloyl-ACP methyl ester carboxylesterase
MTDSPRAVFLHGLAGAGREWDALQPRVPAQAPNLRPHGTRDEYVADVVAIVGRRRVTLIGQSLGGHTAFLVAARRPELVERLVVIEASPARDPTAPDQIRELLSEHPSPYGVDLGPDAAARTLMEIAGRDWWDEWSLIRCPVLVVRGEDGELEQTVAERMVAEVSNRRWVEIPGAGHDVHLEQPDELAATIVAWAP